MCGIAGFVAKQGNLLHNSIISEMTDLIHHRGPDDEGFIFLKQDHNLITAGGDHTAAEVWNTHTEYRPVINKNKISAEKSLMAFGHKRLAILDLTATGHQPMS
jgi:asparagine synthase (glutamine-hydrolysing)